MDSLAPLLRRLQPGQRLESATDAELLQHFLDEQQAEAFAVLVRRHGPMVLRICQRELPVLADAEDAFQATFLVLAQKAKRIKEWTTLPAWLAGVARRLSRRLGQQLRGKRERLQSYRLQRGAQIMPSAPRMPSPSEMPSWWEEERKQLPQEYQTVIDLCLLQGLTREEAAAQMGQSPSAVHGLLYRARLKLKKQLTQKGIATGALLAGAQVTAATVERLAIPLARAAAGLLKSGTIAADLVTPQALWLAQSKGISTWTVSMLTIGGLLVGGLGWAGAHMLSTARERPDAPVTTPLVLNAPPSVPNTEPALLTPIPNQVDAWSRLQEQFESMLKSQQRQSGGQTFDPAPQQSNVPQQAVAPQSQQGVGMPGLLHLAGHQGSVLDLALSPDGQSLASTGEDQQLRIWDTRTGQQRWSQAVTNKKVRSPIVYSPDGTLLAIGEDSGLIRLVDAQTGEPRGKLEGHKKAVSELAFAPNGKLLASASHDASAKIWDMAALKEKHTIDRGSYVGDVAFSPDSQTVAIPGNGGIELWSFDPLKKQRTLKHTARGSPENSGAGCMYGKVCFADEGRVLVGGVLGSGALAIWDLTTGNVRDSIFGFYTLSHPFAVSPDGKTIAVERVNRYGDTGLALLDVATGREIKHMYTPHSAGWEPIHGYTALALAPNGQTVALANRAGKIIRWDTTLSPTEIPAATTLTTSQVKLKNQEMERLWLPNVEWGFWSAAFSPDGKKLFLGGKLPEPPAGVSESKHQNGFGVVLIWDLEAKREVGTIPPAGDVRFGHYNGQTIPSVVGIANSPDGKLLAVATERDVKIWDIATLKEVDALPDQTEVLAADLGLLSSHPSETSVKFSPGGDQLAISTIQGTWIWDLKTKNLGKRISESGGSATFFGEGMFLATAEYHNRVHLWNAATGEALAEDHPEMGILRRIGITKDSRWLVAGGEGGAMIWKIDNADKKPRLLRHSELKVPNPVYGLAIVENDRCITSSDTVRVWDISSGRLLMTFPEFKSGLGAVSSDGKTIAVFVADNRKTKIDRSGVYLWRPGLTK